MKQAEIPVGEQRVITYSINTDPVGVKIILFTLYPPAALERVLKRGLTLWRRVDFIGFLASPERVRPLFKTRS